MSNALKRKIRQISAETITMTPAAYEQLRKSIWAEMWDDAESRMRNGLNQAKEELGTSLEHFYFGIWYCLAAVAMSRTHLSQRTIMRTFKLIDELYGDVIKGKYKADDVARMAEEEAGLVVEFACDRHEFLKGNRFEKEVGHEAG